MKLGTVPPSAPGSNAAPATPLHGTAVSTDAVSSPEPPPPVRPAIPAQPLPSAEAAQQAARQINEFLKSSSAGVEFAVDAKSNQVIVRIVDSETGTLIRQMPSAEMLAISHALDHLTGLLLAQKA